jgi:eukaryotic-like serine/threonine-protein kinase
VTDQRRSSAPGTLDASKTPGTSETPGAPETTGRPDTVETPAGRDVTAGGGWEWDVVSRLLEEALARPVAEREAFLLNACGGDSAVLEEVASLAAAHDAASRSDTASGPLERLAAALHGKRRRADDASDVGRGFDADVAIDGDVDIGVDIGDIGVDVDGDGDADLDADPDMTVASVGGAGIDRSVVGQRIGPYALVREIGRGGMGVVYLARRVDGQYDRDVALKLLRTAAYDARHRERFLAERQFLAMLSHPHIARMFDGGVTAAGQPFFTMEYVDGVRLDRYCDEQRVSIPDRIRLFLQVCDAVSAAHRSLVVHRDIKPNNVLVTRDGTTKLLDFGIATMLDRDAGETRETGGARGAGGAREAGGARDAEDARDNENARDKEDARDVDRHQLRLCTPAYASPEQIRGGAVTAASDVYSLGAVLYELLTGLKPRRALAGDGNAPGAGCGLDANGGHPARRQGDAIERRGEARGVTGDGLRRALAGDLDAIVRKAMHADPAQRYASVDLLRDDLVRHLHHRPVSAHPGGVLYRTRKLIARHRAAVAACVLIVMSLGAGTTVTLVQASRARAREEAAVAEAAMRTKYELAMALHHKGDIAQAAIYFREAAEHGRRMPQFVNTTRVESVLQLARLLHLFERKAAEAEPLYREAVKLARALKPGDHVDLASALNEHAQVLLSLGRGQDAEAPAREALAMWRRLDGGKSEDGLASAQMLADIVGLLGKDDEAEKLYRDALALGVASLREPHSNLIGLYGGLAVFLEKRGRFAEAEPLRRAALRNAVAVYGENHALVARAITGMGDHLAGAGAFEEAERLYRRAVTVRQNIHPAPHWRIAEARSRVGYALFRQQRYEEAETLLTDSYTRLSTDTGAIPESADRARAWLVELYDAWHRPREAARYRVEQPAADTAARRLANPHGPR